MRTHLTVALRRAIEMLLQHWVILLVLLGASIVWLGFGIAVGGVPFFFVILIPVGVVITGALSVIQYRRNASQQPADTSRDGLVVAGTILAAGIVIFGLIQLVPYGRPQSAGASTGEPKWATPQTRELMACACFSCHSNQVVYPWYSNIAPISWTVQHHIDEGRDAVNYSQFATDPGSADESIEVIRKGSMPPGYYTRFGMHPEAKLSEAEKAELIAGLTQTPGLAERIRDGGSGERRQPDHD